MIELDIKVDTAGAALFLRGVQADAIPIASVRALNKVIVTVRKEAIAEVHKVRRIKKNSLRRRMTIVRAKRRHLQASIIANRRPINLKEFGARTLGRGKSARVVANINGKRETFRHAFIIDAANAKGIVVERKTAKRFPLKPLEGPSIGSALIKKSVVAVLNQVIKSKWAPVFTRELQFEIDKRAARANRSRRVRK